MALFQESQLERPFVGVMAGVVFNGIRVLDLAAERDTRIQQYGELELLTSIPADYRQRVGHQSMQRAPESVRPNNNGDDLVFSGAGPGCPRTPAQVQALAQHFIYHTIIPAHIYPT